MHKNSVYLFFVLFLSLNASADVTGYAYGYNTAAQKGLLYTEQYRYYPSHQEVVYKTAKGREFARKTMHYELNLHMPEIVFSNDYCQEFYRITPSVEINNNTSESVKNRVSDHHYIDLHYRNACANKDFKKRWHISLPYVIDAGFDSYIQQNLALIQQQKITFSYPLPSRGRDVLLSASSTSCDGLERRFSKHLNNIQQINSAEQGWAYCVWVKPHNWLLARFFPAIYLAYDDDKRLQFFSGKSNIGDAQGDYKKVLIFYQHN